MGHVLDYQTPHAAYFVFPRIKDVVPLARDSARLAHDILTESKVAVVPGSAFGPYGESHLRITFGREDKILKQGLERLFDYFSKSRRQHAVFPTTPLGRGTGVDIDLAPAVDRERSLKSRLAANTLAVCARLRLQRSKPLVVGIAGLQGKTVVKRMLTQALQSKFKVRASILSYNTEIGLPLSVLDLRSPSSRQSYASFCGALFERNVLSKDDAQILILEYGVSCAKDADRLLRIASPDWLVITSIATADPTVDLAAVSSGVRLLSQGVEPACIIWTAEDAWVKGLRADLQNELGLHPMIDGGRQITLSGNPYQIKREAISQNERFAVIAAAVLADKLGVPRESIQSFLNGEKQTSS